MSLAEKVIEKTLICRDCAQAFAFSVGEQEFFLLKGLKNEPKRCPNCRLVMRVQRNGDDINRTCEVACASCNTATRVPFKPKGYRPVYCVGCFQIKKKEEPGEISVDNRICDSAPCETALSAGSAAGSGSVSETMSRQVALV